MKFNTKLPKETVHQGPVTCLSWSNNDEVYSIGDEHQLFKWLAKSMEPLPTAKLPEDFMPTDLHWLTPSNTRLAIAAVAAKTGQQLAALGNAAAGTVSGGPAASSSSSSSGVSGASDALLLTSTDGRFIILNRSARVERNVTAHTAPISQGRWSPDGAGLLTAGEDGAIKVWSRSGMLRSTVVQNEATIRCACWSPSSDAIAYAQAGFVAIKCLSVNSKLTKWRAHEGMVLSLSWSPDRQHVASGGEDCRYKIWTTAGSVVFASYPEDYAVTSVAFSAAGAVLLAVGGYNSLRLCDANGWSLGHTKFSAPAVGSVYSIVWSPDGTQIAAGSASGQVLFGNIIEQTAASRNLIATTTSRKTIRLQDIASKTEDFLEFPDRIVAWRLDYEHLVVATAGGQVHIYHQKYINTPLAVVEGRAGVRHIELGRRHFMLIDPHGLWVYTYAGRLHLNPKYAGVQMHAAQIEGATVSMGLQFLAVRDEVDRSLIRVFDMSPGAGRQSEPILIQNKTPVTRVVATRAGHIDHQYIVFIDANRDAFCAINLNAPSSTMADVYKIGSQLTNCMWGSCSNILVGLHDASYSIWYCAGEACADPTLVALTTITMDTTEFGKTVSLDSFEGSIVRFGCNGITYAMQVNVFCDAVQRLLTDEQWQQALKVCRRSQHSTVWATLAAIASRRNQLDICAEAFSVVLQVDKVDYLNHIVATKAGPTQTAETAAMAGRLREAETILLHSSNVTEDVIQMCVRLHNWESALDLARRDGGQQSSDQLASVLRQRRDYLKALERDEYLPKYLQLMAE